MVAALSPPARRLRRPSWFEPRLLTGVLLVVVSVATGAKVVSAADRSVQVWALARDLAAGTVLAPDDLRPARVRLFDTSPRYLRTADSPAGRVVTRGLSEGELLPVAALRSTQPGLVVNIPVRPENAPALFRGKSVDVWASTKGCAPERVLVAAPVQEVRSEGVGALSSGAGSLQVVVRVGAAEAERLLAALGVEATIRLVVLEGDLPRRAAAATSCLWPGAAARPVSGGG